MSETITLSTGQTETIHGTFAAAEDYIAFMAGSAATAWSALGDDEKKKTLASAVRFFNAQTWGTDAETFELRDAIAAFATAEYELAVLISDDDSITGQADTGSNIASMGAGAATISFFNPTTKGAAPMPPVLMRLVGRYLATTGRGGPIGGSGVTGDCENPFADSMDRTEGW